MEKAVKVPTNAQTRNMYFIMTIIGVGMLAIFQDFSWSGIALALALIFNPFPDKTYPAFSFGQKALVLGQLTIAMVLIGFSLYQTVVG